MKDEPDVADVDPGRLRNLLEEAGWSLVGERAGQYCRLQPSSDLGIGDSPLLVPLDRSAPDFPELLSAALSYLRASHPNLWFRTLLPRLTRDTTDEFRFAKETSAPSGLINWPAGEELIDSARATLLAGAKAYRKPTRHFSNKFGQFARRYLDTVLMGQTSPGSYVVTAYVPSTALVPFSLGPSGFQLEGAEVAIGGEVTRSVVRALEATAEGISHYHEASSLAAFEAGVERGVSYEMTVALRQITSNADGAEIVVQMNSLQVDKLPGRVREERFEFGAGDSIVLGKAADRLLSPEEPPQVQAVLGRVHLLTKKESAGPGVVGIDDGKRKYRVRLSTEAEYHDAVMAHDQNFIVEVTGQLSREGNMNWLYNARLDQVYVVAPGTLPSGRTFEDLNFPFSGESEE